MKSVLISIQPKWCELIALGKKTIEVRKTKPKFETSFKVYIYCTEKDYDKIFCVDKFMHKVFLNGKGKQKVIGEFVCNQIGKTSWFLNPDHPKWQDIFNEETCLTNRETYEYSKGDIFYEWHISDLVIYNDPKELGEFHSYNCGVKIENGYPMPTHEITRPPQSWCYVEEVEQ